MTHLLIVALGGAVGAVARYAISARLQQRWGPDFPIGTLAVNVLGCLLAGILLAWIGSRPQLSPRLRLGLVVGLLGSLTTFSTFGVETVELLRTERAGAALANVLLNVLLGCAAAFAGLRVTQELVE